MHYRIPSAWCTSRLGGFVDAGKNATLGIRSESDEVLVATLFITEEWISHVDASLRVPYMDRHLFGGTDKMSAIRGETQPFDGARVDDRASN
jgi:hypothetical protein